MEDVCAVAMNLNVFYFFRVDVAADVIPPIDHQDGFPRFPHLLGKGRAEQSRADYQIVTPMWILSSFYSSSFFIKARLALWFRKKSRMTLPSPRQKWPLTRNTISSTIFSLTMPPVILPMARKGIL